MRDREAEAVRQREKLEAEGRVNFSTFLPEDLIARVRSFSKKNRIRMRDFYEQAIAEEIVRLGGDIPPSGP